MSQEPEPQMSVAPHADDAEGAPLGPSSGAAQKPAAASDGAGLSRSERKARAASARRDEEAAAASLLETTVPAAQAYHVAVPAFEGPLDLLLHLIQQHELDIRDIPIAFISHKYVEYITLMQELNIDLASEYLVMAATLAHIKSKLLLPTPPAGQEEEPEEELDPRAELVRRLLEYQKYKKAAEELGGRPVVGRDVFVRGAPAPTVDGPAPLAQVSVFKLLDAFQGILKRVKQSAEHLIGVDRISISERIMQLADILRGRAKVPFEALFEETMTRPDLIVTFLALLEMTRLRMTRVIQDGPLEPIFVELAVDEAAEQRMLDDYRPKKAGLDDVEPTAADYAEEEASPEADPFAAELSEVSEESSTDDESDDDDDDDDDESDDDDDDESDDDDDDDDESDDDDDDESDDDDDDESDDDDDESDDDDEPEAEAAEASAAADESDAEASDADEAGAADEATDTEASDDAPGDTADTSDDEDASLKATDD
jgi:segregation and condensation protein A